MAFFEQQKAMPIDPLPWEPITIILRGYFTLKPSFFHGLLGSKGSYLNLLRGHDKTMPVHGNCAIYFPGGIGTIHNIPLDPLVCPKNPGFPQTNPMTWGWDVSTINPTNFREGSGFLGNRSTS